MKNTKKLFVTLLSLALAVVLFAAASVSTYAAEDFVYPTIPSIVNISTEDMTIDVSQYENGGTPMHTLPVVANGAGFSSFQLQIRLPDFVTIIDVRAGETLANNENQVFESYYDNKDHQVNVTYSSAYNVSDVVLFYVDFTLSDYSEQMGYVEHMQSDFVNENAKTVSSMYNFGCIRVGEAKMGKKGDVNFDGEVTLYDLLIIQRSMVNPSFALSDEQFRAADIDNNDKIDMTDCQYIQNFLVGKIGSLEDIGGGVPTEKTYEFKVYCYDAEGNFLCENTYTMRVGQSYRTLINKVNTDMMRWYDVNGPLYFESKIYGTFYSNDEDFNLSVTGQDVINAYFDINHEEPPVEDWIEMVSLEKGIVGVTVGSDPYDLVAKICALKLTVCMSQSGEQQIAITKDMIRYEDVDLNTVGEYYVPIAISVNGAYSEATVMVCVIEDKGDTEVLGYYVFDETMGERTTLTLYADGTLMMDDYMIVSYETYRDNVITFSNYGVKFFIELDDENKLASFYNPTEPMIGKYVYMYAEGYSRTYEVYGEYNGAGEYLTVIRYTMDGQETMMTTNAHFDLENRLLYHAMSACGMIFDDKNMLSDNHTPTTRIEPPTCTQLGWEYVECANCGHTISQKPIDAFGHEFDANGVCVHCGMNQNPDVDLEGFRENILINMRNEWENLQKMYGDISRFEPEYRSYYNGVKMAYTMSEMESFRNFFDNLVADVHQAMMGGEDKPWVEGYELENALPPVEQGADPKDYINQYVLTNRLVAYMSNGEIRYFPITGDMITSMPDFNQSYDAYIAIMYDRDGIYMPFDCWITVIPKGSNITGNRWLEFYVPVEVEQGTDVEEFLWKYIYNNRLVIEMMDGNHLYIPVDSTMIFYYPDFNGIGPTLLSIHCAHGDFSITWEQTINVTSGYGGGENGDVYMVNSWITNYVPADAKQGEDVEKFLENYILNNYFTVQMSDGSERSVWVERYMIDIYPNFDEYGETYISIWSDQGEYLLSWGLTINVMPHGEPTYDFEQEKDKFFNDIKMQWSELDQYYTMTDEQRWQGHSILERIMAAASMWELEELRREFDMLHDEICGIVKIDYIEHHDFPRTILLGTTMDEFFDLLNRAYLVVHYTDGNEVQIPLTVDNFDFNSIELYQVGEYTLAWSCDINGNFYCEENWIEIIENLGEGATVLGQYDYYGSSEQVYHVAEWENITLYDNGYALLESRYDRGFVRYEMYDGLIMISYDNGYTPVCLYRVMYDAVGNAVGVTSYRPAAAEKIYTSVDEDVSIHMEVFTYNGRYFAYFDLREFNRDGSEDMYELTCEFYYNEDMTKVNSMLLDGWMALDGNELVPCECEHAFTEYGYCIYCGYNPNYEGGSGTTSPDIGYDEEIVVKPAVPNEGENTGVAMGDKIYA